MRHERDESELTQFATMLKILRIRAGLSQQMLAARALVSVQAISALERGYRKAPYRETIGRLAEALDLSTELRAEFETAAARTRAVRSPEQTAGSQAHNLPRQFTTFLGAEESVAKIVALLAQAPLVTIAGTGGVGKTRAAIEAGTRLLGRFSSGVWFVELAHLNDPAKVADAVAGVFGLQELGHVPVLQTLCAYIGQKHVLIVLDNCEHMAAGVCRVALTLINACPNVRILGTSREPFGAAGERVFRIPPLAFPEPGPITVDDGLSYGAIALFVDRALAADASFELGERNISAVAEICRRLDGLPLAIELAAARVTVLSPRQLAERLDRVFSVLADVGGGTLPGHRTMRAVVGWSYGLLSSQGRALFDRLSVFVGGFSLEAATAVCSDESLEERDVLEVLSSLVNRSLVAVDFARGDARYHLLEITRQYALEKLTERGEADLLAARHAEYFEILARRIDLDWYDVPERRWFDETEVELDNFRMALDWSLTAGRDVLTGQRLAAGLARAWYSLAPAEGRRRIVAAIHGVNERTPAPVVAQLHQALAELHGALGQYAASLASAETALALLEGSEDRLSAARAKQTAGSALAALGRGTEGEVLLRQALDGATTLGNERLRALALADLGTARSRNGDVDSARTFYAEALGLYAALGLERAAASIAGNLAEVEFAAGNAREALRRAEEARTRHEAVHNRRSAANDSCNMAAYLIALHVFDDARTHAMRALSVAYEMNAAVLTAFALQHVAAIDALAGGEPDAKRADLERAASVLGFVDARLRALEARREYTEQQEYDRVVEFIETELGSEELQLLMARGARSSEALILSEAGFRSASGPNGL